MGAGPRAGWTIGRRVSAALGAILLVLAHALLTGGVALLWSGAHEPTVVWDPPAPRTGPSVSALGWLAGGMLLGGVALFATGGRMIGLAAAKARMRLADLRWSGARSNVSTTDGRAAPPHPTTRVLDDVRAVQRPRGAVRAPSAGRFPAGRPPRPRAHDERRTSPRGRPRS